MRALVVLLLIVWSAGCAALRPAPIVNPSLSVVGRTAVRAAQVVNAVDIGQRQIEPLVDAGVLTAGEGRSVIKALGVALEQAKNLVALLTLADAAQTVSEQVARMRDAGQQVKGLIKTVGGAAVGVGGFAGRVVVGSIAGTITDAATDAVAVGGVP